MEKMSGEEIGKSMKPKEEREGKNVMTEWEIKL